MRLTIWLIFWILSIVAMAGCVDPLDLSFAGTVDVIVVDGTITNLPEPQRIRLNRSRADPINGRFGSRPLTKLLVQVIVDSSEVINCREMDPGTYELPTGFTGQVGHAYQLRFGLGDGSQYASTQQIMPAVQPIDRIETQFNPLSLNQKQYNGFRPGYDIFIETQDPANERNYYRWDWVLYERQYYCKTCYMGLYAVFTVNPIPTSPGVYRSGATLFDDCFVPKELFREFKFDYACRTSCWAIIRNTAINLFDDQLTNGGAITRRNVAQIPLLTRAPAAAEIRQTSMTPDAYRYYSLFKVQTENTGGLADTPPTALIGNVSNQRNPRENVVGYFTASAVSTKQLWLDKKDASSLSLGAYDEEGKIVPGDEELFYALNRRRAITELETPFIIVGGPPRPPTALCIHGDNQTPVKPESWKD